jgi:hypothetical protein
MSDHPFRRRESDESIDAPDRRPDQANETRPLRLRWRGIRVSVFWKLGIKVTRPKRQVEGRPALVQGTDVKAIGRGAGEPAI